MQPGRTGWRLRAAAPEPEKWWAGLPPGRRVFVREVGGTIRQMFQHPGEWLDIRNTGKGFRTNQSRTTGPLATDH